MDGQTNGHNYDPQDPASIGASRGKKMTLVTVRRNHLGYAYSIIPVNVTPVPQNNIIGLLMKITQPFNARRRVLSKLATRNIPTASMILVKYIAYIVVVDIDDRESTVVAYVRLLYRIQRSLTCL